MTRNEILEVAGKFYTPETITEREVAFARYMMEYEREACADIAENWNSNGFPRTGVANEIRARGQA
jgi:hypothetical protein